jgi:hypothetical protein
METIEISKLWNLIEMWIEYSQFLNGMEEYEVLSCANDLRDLINGDESVIEKHDKAN